MFSFLAKMLRRHAMERAQPAALRHRLQSCPAVEELMPRVLLNASPISVVSGHLLIHGTHGNDVVSVSMDVRNKAKIDVVENHHAYVVNAKGIQQIEFESGGGHDQFMNKTAIRSLVEQSGGSESESGDATDTTDGTDSTDTSLEAALTNSSGATGKAEFSTGDGQLEVQVQGAAANTSLSVVIDGNTVGTITTDSSGNGQMELSQASFTVQAGSTISVGDLHGTFGTSQDS